MALKPMSNRGSSEKTEARHRSAPRSLFGMDGFVTGPTLAVLFGMDGFGQASLSDNSNYPYE